LLRDSNGTVAGCTFTNNVAVADAAPEYGGGGGILVWWDSNPVIANCTFSGNTSEEGLGAAIQGQHYGNDQATLIDNMICGNGSPQISGLWADGGDNCIEDVCDADGDGIWACDDECPDGPNEDIDGDGLLDCVDPCPYWPHPCDDTAIEVPVGANIQAALNSAPAGAALVFEAGSYFGVNLNTNGWDRHFVGAVDADGNPATVISAGGSGPVVRLVHSHTADMVLENLWLRDGIGDLQADGTRLGGAVYLSYGNPIIRNCWVSHSSASKGGGIYCNEYSSASIEGTRVWSCSSGIGSGVAIHTVWAPSVTITNTRVCGCTGGAQVDGGFIDGGGNGFCPSCDDSDADGTLDCDDQCPGEPEVDSDGDGVMDCIDQCPGEEDVDSDGDGVADCVDQCPGEWDDDLDDDGIADCIDPCPMWPGGCSEDGSIIYVAPGEWISAAIATLPMEGGVIELLPGTFDQEVSLSHSGVTLRGSVSDQGELLTVFEGPTTAASSGVVWANQGGSFSMRDLIFRGCGQDGGTGGARLHGGVAEVVNCRFEGCKGYDGGGLFASGTSLNLVECVFTQCESLESGGGMSAYVIDLQMVDCLFEGCQAGTVGGGAFSYSTTTALTRVVLRDNIADLDGGGDLGGGLGLHWDVGASLIDCTLCGNTPDNLHCPSGMCTLDEDTCEMVVCDDEDADGILDCEDQCPGEPDVDEDGNGIADCLEPSCEADLNGDGEVSIDDVLAMLAEFGPCPLGCDADLDGSGAVDINDLLTMLGAWGPC